MGTATEKNMQYFEATGQINPITVTDTRASTSPWSVSASVGDFTDNGKTFKGSFLGWSPKVVTPGAGAVAGAAVNSGYDGGDGLSVSRLLGAAPVGHDRSAGVVGADLDLKIPNTIDKGSYRATLTLTALAG